MDERCSLGISRIFSHPSDFDKGWCALRDRENRSTDYYHPAEPGRERSGPSSFSHASEASDRPYWGRSQRAVSPERSERPFLSLAGEAGDPPSLTRAKRAALCLSRDRSDLTASGVHATPLFSRERPLSPAAGRAGLTGEGYLVGIRDDGPEQRRLEQHESPRGQVRAGAVESQVRPPRAGVAPF